MTDSLVAQREARRLKLMKNAENRMNRLRARPQSESDGDHQDSPSPDIELKDFSLKQHLETENDRTEDVQSDAIRTTPYNLRHRTRQGLTKSDDEVEVQETVSSDAKSSSVPYEIVEDPEVPSLAEFLAKQEATKTTNSDNRQQAFNPNVSFLPPKTPYDDIKRKGLEKQLEYIKVIGLFLTALLSRLFLSYEIGTNFFFFGMIFKSMFLPLVLFEVLISFAAQKFMPGVSSAPPQGSLLSTALMLCGIRPQLIQLYMHIMARVTSFSNDLFLYIFAFLVCHVLVS